MSDPTTDPSLGSWLEIPRDSDFPVQNLPFGVFEHPRTGRRVGVAVGTHILDMAALSASGWFDGTGAPVGVFDTATLNPFLACGAGTWGRVRAAVSRLVTAPTAPDRPEPAAFLIPMDEARLLLPVNVGDYVDFYSSIDHATNLGKLFRPDDPPLLPNWRHMPVAYHGRSSSVVVGGTPVHRPWGQSKPPGSQPVYGPTRRLDFELEVGFITGPGNRQGEPITVADAEDHIFGLVLVNDWSARDLQAWEYQPLGPFLGKSFATSISPWVVPLAALAPYRVPARPQEPRPLAYLDDQQAKGIDLNLAVELNGTTVAQTNFRHVYWTLAQQLSHATVNGANVRPGDLYASGTVSGPAVSERGSLLELTWNGSQPVKLGSGDTRSFLEDGDEVTLRGWCGGDGLPRIGFGECSGRVVPASG